MRMPALNHWLLTDDLLAQQFDLILCLTGIFVRNGGTPPPSGPMLTFDVPFVDHVNSIVGGILGSFSRSGPANYRTPPNGQWRDAPSNRERLEHDGQQHLGLRLSSEVNNNCWNRNANPDAALEWIEIGVNPAGFVLTRELDNAALQAAGLDHLCISQYAIKADNSAGAGYAIIWFYGTNGEPGTFNGSLWLRGTGSGSVDIQESPTVPVSPFPADYTRIVVRQNKVGTFNNLFVRIDPGSVAYIVLNQLEKGLIQSHPIINPNGSQTGVTRNNETMQWPTSDDQQQPIIRDAQGMLGLIVRFEEHSDKFHPASNDGASSEVCRFLKFQAADWLQATFNQGVSTGSLTLRGNDESDAAVLSTLGSVTFNAGQDTVLAAYWRAKDGETDGELVVGQKRGGIWRWGSNATTYSRFASVGTSLQIRPQVVPWNTRNVQIWDSNEGQAWLEDYYANEANI